MDVRQELRQMMEERGISMTAISRAIGRSAAAISQYLSNTYQGNVTQLEDELKGFLQRQKERLKKPKLELDFVYTTAARKTFEVSRLCHLDGEMGLIYGEAGIGKTVAVKEYTKRNQDTVLIEADLGYTAKILLGEIHKALGLGDGKGNIHGMMERIIDRLKGSGRLIIVDEAEHLPYRALELLRRIHDKAGVGIVLAGMPRLRENITGRRGEFEQMHSRIGVAARLASLNLNDTEQIVKSVMPHANGLCKEYHAVSCGNTRRLCKLIARSIRVSEINNMPVSPEIVRETVKMLIV
jgi:DNA transposition AAA+ family ATPase